MCRGACGSWSRRHRPEHRLRGALRPAADGDGYGGHAGHGGVVLSCGPAVVQTGDVARRIAEQPRYLRDRQRTQLGHRKRRWMSEWSPVKSAAKDSPAAVAHGSRATGISGDPEEVLPLHLPREGQGDCAGMRGWLLRSGEPPSERRSSGERARVRRAWVASVVKSRMRRANPSGHALVGGCRRVCAV